MFAVKIVTGRDENGTTYDTDNILRFADESEAIREAIRIGGTKDVFEEIGFLDHFIARVHVDGGIDYARRGF